MQELPLSEYLELPNQSQSTLAEAVGCHQTTISQMLRFKRPMFVITYDNGEVELIERKFKKSNQVKSSTAQGGLKQNDTKANRKKVRPDNSARQR